MTTPSSSGILAKLFHRGVLSSPSAKQIAPLCPIRPSEPATPSALKYTKACFFFESRRVSSAVKSAPTYFKRASIAPSPPPFPRSVARLFPHSVHELLLATASNRRQAPRRPNRLLCAAFPRSTLFSAASSRCCQVPARCARQVPLQYPSDGDKCSWRTLRS